LYAVGLHQGKSTGVNLVPATAKNTCSSFARNSVNGFLLLGSELVVLALGVVAG
jgi:UDP-3-O-acyl-N-acetylglucosamine deacetylase